jgi:imidazolonepropionase-like amidohydrolase
LSRLILIRCRVLDAQSARFVDGSHVVLEGDRILAVATGTPPEPGPHDTVIDLGGSYVLPGLIDSHFHLVSRSAEEADEALVSLSMIEGVLNAATRLEAGVTAVRDCGCRHEGIHVLARAIETGLVPGPRPYVAGTNPTGPGAPAHWRNVVVRGPEALRREVRRQHENGAGWVKLILSHAENPLDWSAATPYLSEEEVAAGVDEAHRLGLKIGCHCEGWETADLAVRAGMDSLDHAPLVSSRTADEMAERGMTYVPTIWAFSGDSGLDPEALTAEQQTSLRRWQQEHRRSVERAHTAGVLIAAGSDAAGSLPAAGVLQEEMRTLGECGLSGPEVLRAATSIGAALMGREQELGLVKAGYLADIVVVDGDPLTDLSVLSSPRLVISRGLVALDRLRPGIPRPPLPAEALRMISETSRWVAA